MDNKAKRRLRKLTEFISKLPKKVFNMDSFAHRKIWKEGDLVCEKTIGDCGTTCCIAGWAIVKAGYCLNSNDDVVTKSGKLEFPYPDTFAATLLGLSDKEANDLFYDWNWPKNENFEPLFKSTPKGAAKRIIHLVETGE